MTLKRLYIQTLAYLWIFFLPLSQDEILAQHSTKSTTESSQAGVRLAFPNHGVVNAFVIFVQHAGENDHEGEYGSDPITEWPADWSLGPHHRLPMWAEDSGLLAPPGTPTASFKEGSLSAFYQVMSHGRFSVTGYVYPQVYVPKHSVDWYHTNRGSFQNGAIRLSHEVLTSEEIQSYFTENPDSIDLEALDTYINGTNTYVEGGDGIFDLIILIDRGTTLPRLRRLADGHISGGSSISSLGVDIEDRKDTTDFIDPGADAFTSDPVVLGGMRIIDNLTSGSGILTRAVTRKQAVRIITHEIGHRHFGFYHTCVDEHIALSDCVGIMGGAYLTMSAGDRIKLGWADVIEIDLLNHQVRDITFPDAIESGNVFRLKQGDNQCGDVIVEARFWSNYWDAPPNPNDPTAPFPQNDDGDQNDLFLPQEGLYLYKSPESGNSRCGGSRNPKFDFAFFSSLENNALFTRLTPFRKGQSEELKAFRPGGTYKVAYEPGDVYAPFSLPRFYYHENLSLDPKLTITAIERADGSFTARVWTDYLSSPPDRLQLFVENYPNPFDDGTIIEYELPREASATLSVYDLLGRRVAILVDGYHQAGVHRIYFDASELPPGTYWCRIESEGQQTTWQMQYVK